MPKYTWRFNGPAPKGSPRYNPVSALMGAVKDERGDTIASMIRNPEHGALIAAAPALVEALEDIAEEAHATLTHGGPDGYIYMTARAALRAARGETEG